MRPHVSVLIVEPSEIIVEGLRSMLEQMGEYNVLAPLHDASALEERLPVMRPDVMIVNPTLLGPSPKPLLASCMQLLPKMSIVGLVYQYVESSVLQSFKSVIDIRDKRSELASVMKSAILTKQDKEPAEAEDDYELSSRETDVLVLVAKGQSSKEIADSLNISVHTVNSHRKNITRKTGIKSVAGLAVYAMIHNLMD